MTFQDRIDEQQGISVIKSTCVVAVGSVATAAAARVVENAAVGSGMSNVARILYGLAACVVAGLLAVGSSGCDFRDSDTDPGPTEGPGPSPDAPTSDSIDVTPSPPDDGLPDGTPFEDTAAPTPGGTVVSPVAGDDDGPPAPTPTAIPTPIPTAAPAASPTPTPATPPAATPTAATAGPPATATPAPAAPWAATPTPNPAPPPVPLEISNILVEPNPNSTLSALVSAQTNVPARAFVQYGTDLSYPSVTGYSSLGTTHTITVVNMRHSTEYHMRVVVVGEDGRALASEDLLFTTGPLPEGIPEILVTTDQPELVQPGVTLFGYGVCLDESSPVFPAYIGVDTSGEVVWYYYDPDFSPNFINRALRRLRDGNFLIQTEFGFREITIGGDVVFDITESATGFENFHHDTLQLPNGRFLALATDSREEAVPWSEEQKLVVGDQIVEMDQEGQVYWVWSTFDHLDTQRYPTELSTTSEWSGGIDWTHSNALVYIADTDAILLSMRNQEWVIKIDHQTGDVLWRFGYEGDFELANYDASNEQIWFSAQHAPEPQPDGTMLVYDNGVERKEYPDEPSGDPQALYQKPFSRGVAYHLDPNTFKATQVWQFKTDYYTSFLGDANKLSNGNVLLCAGGVGQEGEPAQILEVTDDNPSSRVWVLELYGYRIYRAVRLASFWIDVPDVESLEIEAAGG